MWFEKYLSQYKAVRKSHTEIEGWQADLGYSLESLWKPKRRQFHMT